MFFDLIQLTRFGRKGKSLETGILKLNLGTFHTACVIKVCGCLQGVISVLWILSGKFELVVTGPGGFERYGFGPSLGVGQLPFKLNGFTLFG